MQRRDFFARLEGFEKGTDKKSCKNGKFWRLFEHFLILVPSGQQVNENKNCNFYSLSSVSQPKICSSLSEPTLRSFSRHENKTSASHARLCYVRTALVRAMERIVPSAESQPWGTGDGLTNVQYNTIPAAVCSGLPAGDRRGARSTGRRGARSRSHCPRPGATSTCGTGRAPPMTMTMSIWLCQSVGIHWTFIVYKRCHDDGGNRGYFERVQSSP